MNVPGFGTIVNGSAIGLGTVLGRGFGHVIPRRVRSTAMLATTLGLGVALSAIPVLLYQGGITLAAGSVQRFLTLPVLSTLTATGGLLLAAIGLDLTGIKRLPVGNMLPGIFLAAGLAYFFG